MQSSNNNLFKYQHDTTSVTAQGTSRDGGRIALVDNTFSIDVEIDVPSTEFAVFSLLMERGLLAGDIPANGFVTKAQLFLHLRRQFLVDNPQTVTRTVYRLRERLQQAVSKKLGDAESHAWSRSLIEHALLGYRISVAPDRLRLDLLDRDGSHNA